MADEWDDDDFGTFESADASSPVVAEASAIPVSTTTPAWLLPAQQQKANDKESSEIASRNEKVVAAQMLEVNDHHPQNQMTKIQETNNHKELTASNFLSSDGWQAFASIPEEVSATPATNMESSLLPQQTSAFSQVGDNLFSEIDSKTTERKTVELKDSEVQVDNVAENEEIINLKGMLDNAVALKIHTDKSLEELQKEMEKLLAESKAAREQKEQEHAAEIEQLKENQENEINLLKEESQKTMHMLTEKYASLAQQATIERNNEHEKNVEDVIEKCLDILQTQSSVLSEKLSQNTIAQNEAVSELIESCRNELKDFVKSESDSVLAKCEEIKRETGDYLKSEIAKELECQRQIDEKCKRAAMEDLSRSLKAQLEEALKQEREKASDAIKSAVQEARKSVRKEIEEQQKKSKSIRDQHAMALQMLLSSSQDHLRHLTETYCEETD